MRGFTERSVIKKGDPLERRSRSSSSTSSGMRKAKKGDPLERRSRSLSSSSSGMRKAKV